MNTKNIKISIIIVHYNVERELIACISSIKKSKLKESYEIIVVDNDEKKTIDIKKRFPEIKYVPAKTNLGFGGGNNLGVQHSQGEFLFFLNPDTTVSPQAIDKLVNFFQKEKEAGIVAPFLVDVNDRPYPQGSKNLGVLQGIVVLSFINKHFPNNPISKKYLLDSWNKKDIQEVDVVPGTAFMVRKDIFEKIGGFDEEFFLYFEEFDLCKRVKNLGYKLFILPSAVVKHIWEASTKKSNLNLNSIFGKSRFYYFKKHYGLASAFLVELFATLSKKLFLMILILGVGAFLRFYRLGESLPFIGDYAWFYLSARDMVLNGEIPLVGITSSHTWLHQGPLWTYILALILWISNFNPVSGGVFMGVIGIFTIFLIYKICKKVFSERVGLISSLLYTTSPLVVVNDRTPYHTSLIPFFTLLLFFSVYKWVDGKIIFFPLTVFFLLILYNLELATQVLWVVVIAIFSFGVWRKKKWCLRLFNKKTIVLSLIALIIPMIPIFIYDLTRGFPQTFKFLLWVPYRIFKHLNLLDTFVPSVKQESFMSILSFFKTSYQNLIFIPSGFITALVFAMSLGMVLFYLHKIHKKQYSFSLSIILLILFIIIPILGFIINKTPSDAYLPILFPTIIILTGLIFSKIMERKIFEIPITIFLLFIISFNSFSIITGITNDISYSKRLSVAEQIVRKARGREYNLVGEGEGSKFKSFTMNYEYLTWWLGKAPSRKEEKLKFSISETNKGIELNRKIIP